MSPRDEVFTRMSGLYGLADANAADGDPERLAAQLLEGGCRLVQLRAKSWDAAEIERAGLAILTRCRTVGATFILNDDPALAAAIDADGVHIGQTDGDLAAAREALGPGRILGRSTHTPEQAAAALGHADYLAFGPVFATPHLSRPKAVRGLDQLAAIARLVDRRAPLIAIGGITAARLAEVRAAGADAWAVIGAIAHADDPVAATHVLTALA